MPLLDMKPHAFTKEIRRAIADPTLQSALDANAERRSAGRLTGFESLPDYPALRQRAHQVRAEVIENLDQYLDRFIQAAQTNGMIVHRAEDARQAVEIVLNIARKHGASLVAKSKTMVSEEVKLNHALEEAGIRAVETDLGEYIVQLRGEAPSHIITPAVHLRTQDVGRCFQDNLDVPYTDDIPTLTRTARKVLRQVFLDADIGLSGINFGVAETGTLCIVTNEGNGRMVTTLPPVHVALMGIERLVPTMDDLALLLALLPRSATGQKITVYTNLINTPRLPEDADGPSERHLVLVDNGRSTLQNSPLAESLLCIRCGACLNACPIYREIGGHAYVDIEGHSSTYPGPIGSIISPGLFGIVQYGHLARASSLCGACKDACPVDIDLPEMLLRVRAGQSGEKVSSSYTGSPQPNTPGFLALGLRLYTWLAISPNRFALAQRLAGFFARLVSPFIASRNVAGEVFLSLPEFTGWGYSKDFPRPAERTFHQRWRDIRSDSPDVTQIHRVPIDLDSGDHHAIENDTQKSPISLVARFETELTALGGKFIACKPAQLSDHIAALLVEKGLDSLLAWGSEQLPLGLVKALQSQGFELFSSEKVLNGSDIVIPKVGLTGALAGIAETGSLIQTAGQNRPLTASLLPEIHIAVLNASDILPTVKTALQLPDLVSASSAVLITGPSRTADIEMTLTIGVHGPGELYVFLY